MRDYLALKDQVGTELVKLEKIKNFLASFEKGLLTSDRFVFLVKGLYREESEAEHAAGTK